MTAPNAAKPAAPKSAAPATTAPTAAKKGRKAPPADESKEARFRRVAGKRLAKAVRMIGHLERVGRGSAYSYTDAQADKVIQTLVDAIAKVKVAYSAKASKATLEMIEL
jgi:hypothetical protein